MDEFRLDAQRLTLRSWREDDIEPFVAMGRDPEVMRYLGPLATRVEAEAGVARMIAQQKACGHCFWAIERATDGAFLGFCGLVRGKPPIVGEIEIGWRLARHAWGQGYASEAAQASLCWGWANSSTAAIVAITVFANAPSRKVMERLGMHRVEGGDFDHPEFCALDPLRRHILYRIERPANV